MKTIEIILVNCFSPWLLDHFQFKLDFCSSCFINFCTQCFLGLAQSDFILSHAIVNLLGNIEKKILLNLNLLNNTVY